MSRSIEVSESAYLALEAAATAEGTTPGRWLEAHLPEMTISSRQADLVADPAPVESHGFERSAPEDAAPRTLYDLIKHRVGNFSSDYTDLAERHSDYFMEGLLEKRRMGTL